MVQKVVTAWLLQPERLFWYVKFTDSLGSCAKADIKTNTTFYLWFGLLKETKIICLFKKNKLSYFFCKLMFIVLPHYTVLWKAITGHKKTLIKFERTSNKDFYHIDLLCWERPPCQDNRSLVGFKADQCTALHVGWVCPDMRKGGGLTGWTAALQQSPWQTTTEHEWAERSPRVPWRLTTPEVVVAEPVGIFFPQVTSLNCIGIPASKTFNCRDMSVQDH